MTTARAVGGEPSHPFRSDAARAGCIPVAQESLLWFVQEPATWRP